MNLDEFQNLLNAETAEDIEQQANKLAQEMGFTSFLYGVVQQTLPERPDQYISSNYPLIWLQSYEANAYIKVDPAFQHCIKRTQPYVWKTTGHAPENQQVFDEAESFGLKHGISIPIHDPKGLHGIFSLATDYGPTVQNIDWGGALLLSNFMHAAYSEKVIPHFMPDSKIVLTAREKECLQWTSAGKTAWEIGQILNVAERTVVFHLNNGIQKLGAQNKNQAIAKAAILGLLT